MDKLRIRGGKQISGAIRIGGAKNAVLPAMAASLLTSDPVTLENVPDVWDVGTMRRLLLRLGTSVSQPSLHEITLETDRLDSHEASYELVKTMRASVLVLGPLLARHGRARVSLPGGCAIGARPIDQHLRGLETLGARISLEHGFIDAETDGLRGAEFRFDGITVGGTENIMMAACLARGETVLRNCAREPEIADLAELLNGMGARIEGAGTERIRIEGVERLHETRHSIVPDRIETGYLRRRQRAGRRGGRDPIVPPGAPRRADRGSRESRRLHRDERDDHARARRGRATESGGCRGPPLTRASPPTSRRSSWCS